MLLTLHARRAPALPSRRGPHRVFAIVAAICVGSASAVIVRHVVAPAVRSLEQPVWAGSIGTGVDGPLVMPSRETSASYTSPVVIQAASDAAARTARSCGPDGICPPSPRAAKALMPPRRPALPSVAAAPAPAASEAPDAKSKPIFSARGLMARLPSPSVLLKPFTAVGDTMSGLIKRF